MDQIKAGSSMRMGAIAKGDGMAEGPGTDRVPLPNSTAADELLQQESRNLSRLNESIERIENALYRLVGASNEEAVAGEAANSPMPDGVLHQAFLLQNTTALRLCRLDALVERLERIG